MSKINLNEVRGFGDSITATFSFVKQEFKPLIFSLGVLVAPLIFLDLFLKSFILRNSLSMLSDNSVDGFSQLLSLGSETLLSTFASGVVYLWLTIVIVSYIKVYYEKYQAGDESRIMIAQVWQTVKTNIGRMLLGGFVLVILLAFAFIVLIVPGIYFSVALMFTLFYIGIQRKSLDESLSGSMTLVKGKWWYLFWYAIVLYFIVSILAYVFNLPYLFFTFAAAFGETIPDAYGLTIGMMFANFGQYIAQGLILIGLAVKFFSLLEEKEHVSLFQKIDQMGENTQTAESEGER